MITQMTETRRYLVIHPLDDAPEVKRNPDLICGRMHMSRSVRASLLALRAYLFGIGLLLLYKLVVMGSVAIHHPH